ncbi:hypothetical protein RchiOBHm_Chr3g0459071 [Rosa chinensis]|uniref:Uncharacterized protein n=1 Tax=Rosa chinensis TaxID=74649 RepID=A0A2P6R810_ROSCH|nr:hypothetical protein RchiOBHm_Chr3g0459071 [Rosa chinensis]
MFSLLPYSHVAIFFSGVSLISSRNLLSFFKIVFRISYRTHFQISKIQSCFLVFIFKICF